MGTAKYDHPGFVADTGVQGKFVIGVWCPHGYPAHIHIGRFKPGAAAEPNLRLRIPDGVFQSISDDMENLCRRALGQAIADRLLVDAEGGYQETRFRIDAVPWTGPLQALAA
ncbi:hypothetical protein [Bordetella hinzii]|uniref:Uncharacterized protein n=2 Tax=Bordetella hinzii TaxID=103855 RepID=A0AAN1VI30_9BORD|nr:hypothetical protein [Bordetella hinzii]AKQ55064.1 hypothetical protein ACR54_01743 [Bordetella hinzii]AKQ59573.1 hypothetical protein ACR55_01701 [Bordetella hinzii]AZW19287.1 hypothetical protein CS347_22295 [Bordetella hinzii]KCB24744.1 hypothetical protein L544_0983 [Bordetella hinzii OH87 BAL007II]KCB26996.1 hypothetical protein L541_1775 [Bordetella hinzii CA90 BAL1384]